MMLNKKINTRKMNRLDYSALKIGKQVIKASYGLQTANLLGTFMLNRSEEGDFRFNILSTENIHKSKIIEQFGDQSFDDGDDYFNEDVFIPKSKIKDKKPDYLG